MESARGKRREIKIARRTSRRWRTRFAARSGFGKGNHAGIFSQLDCAETGRQRLQKFWLARCLARHALERRRIARRTKILFVVSIIPIKITCPCGQKYAFDVLPADGGKMPGPVFCPACGRDGTFEAEQFITRILKGRTQPLSPPSVNSLLNSVQSTLAPHLSEALKNAVVQELAAQRRQLLAAQQEAAAELSALVRRLEKIQMPMMERLRAYEERLQELQKELAAQTEQNRELLKMKIEVTRRHLESERSRISFN